MLKPPALSTPPQDVRRVLAKIFLALAEDRITTRKAAVLCYLAQTLLHTHREIAYQKKLREEEESRDRPLILDMPRPIYDDEPKSPSKPATVAPSSPSSPAAHTEQSAARGSDLQVRHNGHSQNRVASGLQPGERSATEDAGSFASAAPEDSAAKLNVGTPVSSKPIDCRHFYPVDPTFHPSIPGPDPNTNIPPELRPGSRNFRSRARPALRRYGGFNP